VFALAQVYASTAVGMPGLGIESGYVRIFFVRGFSGDIGGFAYLDNRAGGTKYIFAFPSSLLLARNIAWRTI
jgi:hypothetical protein